jgi:Ca2+-binding EF-hand superfamily protein
MAGIADQHAECPISLEPLYKGDVGVFLDAAGKRTSAHFYSFAAAEEWLKTRSTCPMSRKRIASVKKLPELSQDPQAWFRVVDWDGDGKLSREEVIRAMQAQLNLDMEKVEHLIKDDGVWSRWDGDGSGFIEPREITSIQGFVQMPEFMGGEAARIPDIVQDKVAWFDYWDTDKGCTLGKEEVVRALVKTLRQKEFTNYGLQDEMRSTLDLIWFLFDPDMDGEITKQEFLKTDGLAETVIAQLASRPPSSATSPSSSAVDERLNFVPPVPPNSAQALMF